MAYRPREDVGTEQRKRLTPTQVLALFEFYKGVCPLCEQRINEGEDWRDEHLTPLGLGGTNKFENRAPVHVRCAQAKNKTDLPAIARAKRKKRAALGIKAAATKKIESRGFAPTEKKPKALTKQLPPRRNIFTGEVIR